MAGVVRRDVDRRVHDAQQDENPGQDDEQEIGLAQEQRQDGEHVEQHRQLELIVVAIGNLLHARRPVALAERDVLYPHLAPTHGGETHGAHPHQQREGQRHQHEQRRENLLNRHRLCLTRRR